MHCHFAIVCSRITWFSPKCPEITGNTHNGQILNILIKYFWELVMDLLNKMLSYHRQTVQQGALVFAKSERLELGDNILWTL